MKRKQRTYFAREKAREKVREEGREEGINIGREKGREKERKVLVNLLKKKMPISFISEVTDWSEEKVLKLIKELGLKNKE